VWARGGGGGAAGPAATLTGTVWAPLPAPLDADPARSAGTGASRPQVALTAGGSAVAVWGEAFPDGSTHVFARRLAGTAAPGAALEAGVPAIGAESGGSADSPRVDADAAGKGAWVVFRQDVGGRSRSLARRLDGTFGDPVALDGGATSRNPAIALGGATGGVAVTAGQDGTVLASLLAPAGTFAAPVRVDGGGKPVGSPPGPLAAWSDDRPAGVVAFRSPAAAGDAVAFGRLAARGGPLGPQARLSARRVGPVLAGTLRLGSDVAANAVVAMVQGVKAGARRVTVAFQDSPPGPPVVSARYVAGPRPLLRWTPGWEAFGAQSFRVRLDRRPVGTTAATSLRVGRKVADGRHTMQVEALDRRRQATTGPSRAIVVDSVPPKATVTAARRGRVARVTVRASDDRSGVAGVDVRWGDGRTSTSARRRVTLRHRFAAKGARRIVVTVRDRAGNRVVRRLTA
jgi:hypothetical protein